MALKVGRLCCIKSIMGRNSRRPLLLTATLTGFCFVVLTVRLVPTKNREDICVYRVDYHNNSLLACPPGSRLQAQHNVQLVII